MKIASSHYGSYHVKTINTGFGGKCKSTNIRGLSKSPQHSRICPCELFGGLIRVFCKFSHQKYKNLSF